jgi:hypothetical protein
MDAPLSLGGAPPGFMTTRRALTWWSRAYLATFMIVPAVWFAQ